MRELISEASRSIEDSQTAQALHGLLSLKSLESTSSPNDFPSLMRVISSSGPKTEEFVSSDSIPGMTNSAPDQSTSASSLRPGSQAFLRDFLKEASMTPTKAGARPGVSLVVRMPSQGQDQQHSAPKTKAIKPKVLAETVPRTPLAVMTSGAVHASPLDRLQMTGGGEQVMTGLQLPVIAGKNQVAATAEGQYRVVFVTPPTTAKTVQSIATSGSLTTAIQPEVQQAVPLQLIATSCGMLAFPQNIQLQQLVRQSSAESATLTMAPTQAMTPIVITPTSVAKKQTQSSGWPLSFVAATPTSTLDPAVSVSSTKRKISPASADPNRQTKLLRTSLATAIDSTAKSIIYSTPVDDKSMSRGLVFSSQSTALRAPAIAPRDSSAMKGVVSPIIVDVRGNQLVSMLPRLATAPLPTSTTTATTPILSAQLLSNSFVVQRGNDSSGSSVDLLALAAESSGCQATSFGMSGGVSDVVVEKRDLRLTSQISDGFDKFFGKLQSQSSLRVDSNGTREEVRGGFRTFLIQMSA